MLRLELDKLLQRAKTEERRWLTERTAPRVPTMKIVVLPQLLADVDHAGLLQSATLALELHDYQYHGLGPSRHCHLQDKKLL